MEHKMEHLKSCTPDHPGKPLPGLYLPDMRLLQAAQYTRIVSAAGRNIL